MNNCKNCRNFDSVCRCNKYNILIGKQAIMGGCFELNRKSSIKTTLPTNLFLPVNKYVIWLKEHDNIQISIKQISKNQDDYKILLDYIESKYGICKMKIVQLKDITEIEL